MFVNRKDVALVCTTFPLTALGLAKKMRGIKIQCHAKWYKGVLVNIESRVRHKFLVFTHLFIVVVRPGNFTPVFMGTAHG